MRLLIHDYAGHPFQVQLSRELANRGHVVTHAYAGGLLTPRGNLHRKPGDPDNLELCEVPMDPNYRRDKYRFLRRRRMEAGYGKEITKLIQRMKPEVVISGNTPTEPQWMISKTCVEQGISFVPWVQDFYSMAVERLAAKKFPVLGNLVGWWYRQLERKTFSRAARVIAITEDFVPLLERFGVARDRVEVIPNWAPLDELPMRPRRNPWSAAHGLDGCFVFLYSGTLAMKHNPDILRRLAESFKDDPAVRVVVISEGPGADYLREKAGRVTPPSPATSPPQLSTFYSLLPSLIVLPFQSFEQMPDVMGTADVLVAILEADAGVFSVPSKVLTYHCAGRPILAAMPAANLASRIIRQAESGICVEPQDFPTFINAAMRLRRDDALREQMGSKARSHAVNNFGNKMVASRFESCLNRAVRKEPGPVT